jgi:hypothetical protein
LLGCFSQYVPNSKQEAAKRYLAGENTQEIGRSIKVTGETVRRWLEALGVPRRTLAERNRKYECNEVAFEVLTPTAAYYAGLLMADGWVRKGKSVAIELHERDEVLLVGLRKFLSYTGPFYRRKRKQKSGSVSKMVALHVTAPQLVSQLAKWGVVPRKSQVGAVGPRLVQNPALASFFYRGLFDGDGCAHRRPNGKLYLNLCGTPKIIDSFRDWCWREVRQSGSLNRRSRTNHVVQFGGKTAQLVGSLLYGKPAAPRLKRKARLFRAG